MTGMPCGHKKKLLHMVNAMQKKKLQGTSNFLSIKYDSYEHECNRQGEGARTCSSLAANLVLVRRSKPPPRWRCRATAIATRTSLSAADSACFATWHPHLHPSTNMSRGELASPQAVYPLVYCARNISSLSGAIAEGSLPKSHANQVGVRDA